MTNCVLSAAHGQIRGGLRTDFSAASVEVFSNLVESSYRGVTGKKIKPTGVSLVEIGEIEIGGRVWIIPFRGLPTKGEINCL